MDNVNVLLQAHIGMELIVLIVQEDLVGVLHLNLVSVQVLKLQIPQQDYAHAPHQAHFGTDLLALSVLEELFGIKLPKHVIPPLHVQEADSSINQLINVNAHRVHFYCLLILIHV
jgi:hypothetical protein